MTTYLDAPQPSPIATMVRGLGFDSDETPGNSTTLHDVLVALTCFEKLYAPLETVPKFLYLLGDLFPQLIKEKALEFIWWDAEEGIAFSHDSAPTGGISSFVIQSPTAIPLTLEEKLASIMQVVQIHPLQRQLLTAVVARGTTRVREDYSLPICSTIQHTLRLPSVRRLLGFSKSTPHDTIPRWLAHPVLRSARLTRAAETCRILRATSIKFPFGAKKLATALLASPSGSESADNATNYVLYGSFRLTLPATMAEYRGVVRSLLRFRSTQAAERHRNVIHQHLATDDGADCVAAIEAALRSAIPSWVLQESHDQFSEFLLPQHGSGTSLPALWTEANGDSLANWRAHARTMLAKYCAVHRIATEDSCPCGSTISVRDCCLAALSW